MDQTESSIKGRIRKQNRKKRGKMDIIQNHRERQSIGRDGLCRRKSIDLRSDCMLLDDPSFFLEALSVLCQLILVLRSRAQQSAFSKEP